MNNVEQMRQNVALAFNLYNASEIERQGSGIKESKNEYRRAQPTRLIQ